MGKLSLVKFQPRCRMQPASFHRLKASLRQSCSFDDDTKNSLILERISEHETKGICELNVVKPRFYEVCLWLDQRQMVY
jgi:hypothetical protein